LAFYAWMLLEPGLARALCFNVMLVAGVSTLVFNGNPLLRYDAYYILADLIEVPNLARQATRYWGYLVERWVMRVPDAVSPATTAVERADIGFFLWGATVDTGLASSDVNVNKDKRENLVRSGNLKKNSAIGTFNTTLDTFTTGATAVLNPTTGLTYTQNEINQLKFEKRDVDGSGTRAFAGVTSGNDFNFLTDALLVDKFNGKSYTNFDDQAVAFAPPPHGFKALGLIILLALGGAAVRHFRPCTGWPSPVVLHAAGVDSKTCHTIDPPAI
jgi:hypothetical protein